MSSRNMSSGRMSRASGLLRCGLAALALTFTAAEARVTQAAPAQAASAPMVVTILGSGSPGPSEVRFSQSILVEAGEEKLLFDAGRGASIRLNQLGIPLRSVTATFLTHLHSDHLVGLPDLWLTGWLTAAFGGRKAPMTIYGPVGTLSLTQHLTTAFAADIRTRQDDEGLPASGIAFDAHEIGAGTVYQRGGVTVTAFTADHGEKIQPNFGYVIEYGGKKVVLSGDTKYDERVFRRALGADLLLHEVAAIDPEIFKTNPGFRNVEAHHTTPEQAGQIFTLARPKLAAFTHLIVVSVNGRSDGNNPTDDLFKRTRTTYRGPLVGGEDLMRFEIGDDVTVFNQRRDRVELAPSP